MRTATLWVTALGIVLGFVSAYAGLHGAPLLLVCILLLMFGGLLGYLQPEKPWRWGLVLGIWVPLAEIVYRFTEPFAAPPSWGEVALPLLVLLPAVAGAYLGALVRRALPHPPEQAQ